MKLIALQPRYHAGENPDQTIADFLLEEMSRTEPDSLVVLPEYSNAGGLSDPEKELRALPRAEVLLEAGRKTAAEKGAYAAVNVLESRQDKLYNSTYLFDPRGETVFVYDKIHLPPSEIALGITPGDGACVCEVDGIRFGFLTCYDIYYNEQIEYLASQKPDVIVFPVYQRGERCDIIRAQAKLTAFRCNAWVVRSSYSMEDENRGGCSMIVAPDGEIIQDLGAAVGSVSAQVDIKEKYMRTAGFGGGVIPNDEFIALGLRPEVFKDKDRGGSL